MNVLYVEDYALVAALVHQTLKRRAPDVQLEIVSTVAQALERLHRFESGRADPTSPDSADAPRYDLVLTDLDLPDGLGVEILAHVRRRSLMLAVVVLSSSEDEDTVASAIRAGADAFITKRDDYIGMLPQMLRATLDHFLSKTARGSTQ